MKNVMLVSAIILVSTLGIFAQAKTINSDEIINQIKSGKAVSIENVIVVGDLDLTNPPDQVNDAVYPEKDKTAKVFSGIINQSISFKNVKFTGNVNFFRSESDAKEIREYRVQFKDAVVFENCTFEKNVNFELTNFDNGVSFAGSVFKKQPFFVRIGLEKSADFSGTVFEQNAIFQFTQNTERKTLSAVELQNLFDKLKGR